MTRISVVDEIGDRSGLWFDPGKAESWTEATHWDGRNHISVATGSQWEHETLYRTAKGSWVLHARSDWQGSHDSYYTVSENRAFAWLMLNKHHHAAERYFPEDTADAEV